MSTVKTSLPLLSLSMFLLVSVVRVTSSSSLYCYSNVCPGSESEVCAIECVGEDPYCYSFVLNPSGSGDGNIILSCRSGAYCPNKTCTSSIFGSTQCCCSGENLCNYVEDVTGNVTIDGDSNEGTLPIITPTLPVPDKPDEYAICEYYYCEDEVNKDDCVHDYLVCAETEMVSNKTDHSSHFCQAIYFSDPTGMYSLHAKSCIVKSTCAGNTECYVDTTTGNHVVECCCEGDLCNRNPVFSDVTKVVGYVEPDDGECKCSHDCGDNGECLCRDGYILSTDGVNCVEIDECETDNGGCIDICVDRVGGVECLCNEAEGRFKSKDGTQCYQSLTCEMASCDPPNCMIEEKVCFTDEVFRINGISEIDFQQRACVAYFHLLSNGSFHQTASACIVNNEDENCKSECVLEPRENSNLDDLYYCCCTETECNFPDNIVFPVFPSVVDKFFHTSSLGVAITTPTPSSNAALPSSSVITPEPTVSNNQMQLSEGIIIVIALLCVCTLLAILAVLLGLYLRYSRAKGRSTMATANGSALNRFSNAGTIISSSSTSTASANLYQTSTSLPLLSRASALSSGGVVCTMYGLEASGAVAASSSSDSVQLLGIIGHGKFAVVHQATWKGKKVAVKKFYNDPQARESWDRERDIYSVADLKNDNVLSFVAVQGSVSPNGTITEPLLLVTEYHSNGSLYDFLKMHTVTLQQFCLMAKSAANGLHHLHEEGNALRTPYKPSIAHRDLKSKNILVKDDLTCAIGDFGLAIKLPSKDAAEARAQVGTTRYMAPEVLERAISFHHGDAFLHIDIYAFGLILWEISSRVEGADGVVEFKPPFDGLVSPNPSVSEMKELIVNNGVRPSFTDVFNDSTLHSITQTIAECWDAEAEARPTACTVASRIEAFMSANLLEHSGSTSTAKDSGLTTLSSNQCPCGSSNSNTTLPFDEISHSPPMSPGSSATIPLEVGGGGGGGGVGGEGGKEMGFIRNNFGFNNVDVNDSNISSVGVSGSVDLHNQRQQLQQQNHQSHHHHNHPHSHQCHHASAVRFNSYNVDNSGTTVMAASTTGVAVGNGTDHRGRSSAMRTVGRLANGGGGGEEGGERWGGQGVGNRPSSGVNRYQWLHNSSSTETTV